MTLFLKHTIAYLSILILASSFLYGMFALASWEINIAHWHFAMRIIYCIPQGYVVFRLTKYYLESVLKLF